MSENIETIPVLLKVQMGHGYIWSAIHLVQDSLTSLGLEFRFKTVVLDEEDICALYPHLPDVILIAQLARFANKQIGAWKITGIDAIAKVNAHKGSQNNPKECSKDSWRYQLDDPLDLKPVKLFGKGHRYIVTVFDNYIHAPKREEVERDWGVLKKFFP